MSRIDKEKGTVAFMVHLYCARLHGAAPGERRLPGLLCPDCERLLAYALARLDRCRYGERKTSCRKCPTHCYAPAERAAIKAVMRYSGPRMLYARPLEALRHALPTR